MSFKTTAKQHVEVTLTEWEAREIATSYLCRLFQLPPDGYVDKDGHVATSVHNHGYVDSVRFERRFERDGKTFLGPVKPTTLESAAMAVLDHVSASRFKPLPS